ncbi:hypothetical protein [Thalassotalea marina]|uniref:Uncharacterized protein n=1 Tax=Thalassotalea marina TaxID=1673741 RepID=A0A919BNR7_9GAMM|nr:hypothetical protein [Thalassotalea marina]GHG03714.1 hypothetical protein GCM10017161_36230 [Thalassotalea marina]
MRELHHSELNQVNAGILPIVATVFKVIGGIGAVASIIDFIISD